MNIDDYNVLSDIRKELLNELNELDIQLQYNKRCVKDADLYAKSFINSEPEDFKVFSPRNSENIYKEEIKRTYSEKADYENLCHELEEKRNILENKISRLENVLKNENDNLSVLRIQEEDRQRIARDLHDTSLQNDNQKYKVILDIENVSCENNEVLVSIYRIVQESLNNIVKHADCSTIHFSCKNINNLCILDIMDDGKGFDTNDKNEGKHFGLSLMIERVRLLKGQIKINSIPGKGTKIHIEIPLKI